MIHSTGPWPASSALRPWQTDALATYSASDMDDFLCASTPGAGKTTFGLRIAHELLSQGVVERVAVVVPTRHLCRQWAREAARVGIQLDPWTENTQAGPARDYQGYVVTYQGVGANPEAHRARCGRRTLCILDEPHHLGTGQVVSKMWAAGVERGFELAVRRLLLTGTPFRSDRQRIPFVRYEDGACCPDYAYDYEDALRDGVCRPIYFPTYDGEMRWWAGSDRSARFGDPLPADQRAQRLRTALDPDADWLPHVMRDAHQRLQELRAMQYPRAGGLIVARDHSHARQVAALVERETGTSPVLVLSDLAAASRKIEEFRAGQTAWMVAVRMVSEGVDVERLCVGVYATNYLTELYFRQVVGRFVRRIRELGDRQPAAALYIAEEATLVGYAQRIAEVVSQTVVEEQKPEGAELPKPPVPDVLAPEAPADGQLQLSFIPLGATAAPSSVVLHGVAYPRDALPAALGELSAPAVDSAPEALTDRKVELRRAVARKANAFASATGMAHAQAQHLVNVAGGAARGKATLEQLQKMSAALDRWLSLARNGSAGRDYAYWLREARG
jgi:superfamily II DNA or RNA helicase